MLDFRTTLTHSLNMLYSWISQKGWAGIDHYDILDHSLFRFLSKRKVTFYFQQILIDLIPGILKLLFNVKDKINAKGMALLCEGFIENYLIAKNEIFLDEARKCAEWLLENHSLGFKNLCWGYPFNWYSNQLLKAGTPSGVVTSHVVNAFLRLYEITLEKKYLDASISACKFFEQELNITKFNEEEISFSYTPFDHEVCYNASILVAAAIIKANYFDNNVSTENAIKAMNFVLNKQLKDGSWHYMYPNDGRIDPYHTGFILRALYDIYKIFKDEKILRAIFRGTDYFQENLLIDKTIPVYRSGRKYPIDIHSCAETILTFTTLSDINDEFLKIAIKSAEWTIKNMQSKSGYFFYRKYPFYKVRIAYFRWAQAWMFFALSRLQKVIKKSD